MLYLCCAVAQPTMGKAAAVLGERRVFVAGLLILLLGGVIGTTAPVFELLVVSRALIGIGTSAAYPTAMALVRRRADKFGTGVPNRVLGNFAIAGQVIAVLGLPIGGVLTGVFGWRAVFFVNVPMVAVALPLVWFGVPRDGPSVVAGGRIGGLLRAVDIPGIALFAATVVALLLFVSGVRHPVWWLAVLACGAMVALVAWEQRASSPLIDVRMLASHPPLVRTYLRQALGSLGNYLAMYGLSQWMEGAAGYTAAQVGLLLVPLSALSIVVARVNSSHGWVRGPLLGTGGAFAAAGALMLGMDHRSPVALLLLMSLLLGVADGLSGYANQTSLYVQSPADQVGVAAGLFRTFAYFGAIASSSLIGIAFGSRVTDAGFHVIACVIVGLGGALVAMTVADRAIPRTAGV
ncbi:MFS transporter [Tsukamurella soli]|uniref:MFS transporter n=1 Tax=Tsukamurella soli TaxID=644556 RepID=UPI0036239888